jgi:PAS domain S-box-containing protein
MSNFDKEDKGLSGSMEVKQWASTFEALNQGIILFDQNGLIHYSNTALREMLGYYFEDLQVLDHIKEILDGITGNRLSEKVAANQAWEGFADVTSASFEKLNCRLTLIPTLIPTISEKLFLLVCSVPNQMEKELLDNLERKNRQYELAIKGTRNGLWDWNLLNNESYYSPQWFEMLGFSPGDLPYTLQTFYDLLHPEDYFRIIRTINAYVGHELDKYDVEFRLRQKNGEYKWVHGRGEVLFDKDEKPYRFIGFNRDISEKKIAEELIASKEREYRSIINSLQEVIFKTDIYGNFILLNPFWEQLTGYKINNTLGESFNAYLHPEEELTRKTLISDVISGIKTPDLQKVRFLSREGKVIWLELFIRPLLDEESRMIVGTYGSMKDVSEQRKARIALEEIERKRDEVLSSIDDVVWSYNLETGELIFFGNAIKKIYGHSASEFKSNQKLWWQVAHANDRHIAYDCYQKITKGTPHEEVTYRIVNPKGQTRWIRIKSKNAFNNEGKTLRIDGTVADITSLKLTEQALIEQEKEYRKVVTSLSEAILKFNEKGLIEFVNPAWEGITGLKEERVIGKNFFDFIFLGDLDQALEYWTALKGKAEHKERIQLRLIHKKNQFRWVELSLHQSMDEDVREFYAAITDITDKKEAEELLTESERKYRFISENLNDIVLLLDWKGNFEYISASIQKLGFTPAELERKKIFQLVNSDDEPLFRQMFEKTLENGVETICENQYVVKGGGLRWYETLLQPVKGAGGEVIKVQVSAREISERIKTRKALQDSESRFRTIAETLPIPVLIASVSDNKIIYTNQSLVKDYHYQPNEIMGRSLLRFFKHKIDIRQNLQILKNKGVLNGVEFETLKRDGSSQWVSAFIRPIIYESKPSIIMVFYDISDRKAAEEKLKESEEKYRMISENISDLVCIHNEAGEYTYISPSIKDLLGYNTEQWQSIPPFGMFHPEDEKLYFQSIDPAYLFQKETITQKIRFKHAKGQFIWFETISKPLFNDLGELTGIQTVSRNISNFIVAEEEIQKALAKEKELSELKSRFVTMASHEFRTPLTAIRSSMELLSIYSENLNEEVKAKMLRHHDKVIKETKRLTGLMNDILILGRAEAGKTPFEPRPTDLIELCNQVIELHEIQEKERRINFEIVGNFFKIDIDPELMTHVISNLVSNAIKYSKGKMDPILRIHYLDKRVRIQVIDFGIGIPEDECEKLFQSFFRARNVSNIQGTGLGLVIVKQLIDLHKGQIKVESKVNSGTTFTIELPIKL